jgi:hypothetical protein
MQIKKVETVRCHMKTRKIFILLGRINIGFLCLLTVFIAMPALTLAQTEPCTVDVTATCNGSTDCSGSLGGGITVKNTGTNTITCQIVYTDAILEDFVLTLSPGENYGYGWILIGTECSYSHEMHGDGRVDAHCQVGCNPDAVCEDYAEWQCSATCEATISADIKPRICPNTITLRDKGLLPVAIMGDADLDLTAVNPASIRLSRDGFTGTVAPVSWNIKEIGSPFSVELCECIKSKRDVYSDLVLNFDVQQVINVLGLGTVLGQTLPLTISGRMTEECDGRSYIKSLTGRDCVLIQR